MSIIAENWIASATADASPEYDYISDNPFIPAARSLAYKKFVSFPIGDSFTTL